MTAQLKSDQRGDQGDTDEVHGPMQLPLSLEALGGPPDMLAEQRRNAKPHTQTAQAAPNGKAGKGRRAKSAQELPWPDPMRFPHNNPDAKVNVGAIVLDELRRSRQPLIITGFTSLPLVVDLFSHYQAAPRDIRVRLMFGHEPFVARKQTYRKVSTQTFSREVEEYWLARGISLTKSAEVLAAIDFLESSAAEVRISSRPTVPVHAKMYRADFAITIGSSNLTPNGMRAQFEANRRHEVMEDSFREAEGLAESLWAQGRDYKEQLVELLKKLLQTVDWQEALARACAEILDGLWARRYAQVNAHDTRPQLWPAQLQGLSQAMWLIEQVGSVLVADATGSGKTRLGAEILRAMVNRLWAHGRMRNHIPVVVAPPRVLGSWKRDTREINLGAELFSNAQLSSKAEKQQGGLEVLQRAQVLALDEAHNFLNASSNRSRTIQRAAPEHTLLLTATPINRDVSDLLTIINLLGPDNFEDKIIRLVDDIANAKPVARGGRTPMSDEDYDLLQRAISQFTLRRTKHQFNSLIDREPDAYRNGLGNRCRYPKNKAAFYLTGESEDDERWIGHIRSALSMLNGMVFIHKTLKLPDSPRWRNRPDAAQVWAKRMLQGAKALAAYHVMAALRSSRVAALEHIVGTHEAWSLVWHASKAPLKHTAETGNLLHWVKDRSGRLPVNELGVTDLPLILVDEAAHRQAGEREAQIYGDIQKMILQISDLRETTKAEHIAEQMKRHKLLLAFDARPITLHDIHRRLEGQQVIVRIATSERPDDCERVMKEFRLGSTATGIVALCTDAMSEGINLQAGSVIVHLDLPTVVRRLEQRDGRLSRMDSDHPEIESWLPKDSAAFAPRSGEEAIYRRYRMVQTLLGGNVTLPTELEEPPTDESRLEDEEPAKLEDPEMTPVITPEEVVAQRKEKEAALDALPDAFSPVRALISGAMAIVPTATYEHYRTVESRVVSSVATVRAEKPWIFLCLRGSEHGAPRFVLMMEEDGVLITALETVCDQLRDLLGPNTTQRDFDTAAADQLNRSFSRLNKDEETLLPRKKQRALAEMRAIVPEYDPNKKRRGSKRRTLEEQPPDPQRSEIVEAVLDLLNGERVRDGQDGERVMPNLAVLADRWLSLIHPTWLILAKQRRRNITLLRHLRAHLLSNPLTTNALDQLLVEAGLWTQPFDERVVAAIVGVVDPAPDPAIETMGASPQVPVAQ